MFKTWFTSRNFCAGKIRRGRVRGGEISLPLYLVLSQYKPPYFEHTSESVLNGQIVYGTKFSLKDDNLLEFAKKIDLKSRPETPKFFKNSSSTTD